MSKQAPSTSLKKHSRRGSFDYLTLLGAVLAVGAIVGGNWLEGGKASSLLQLTALVIVLGGTVGAVLIQTPWRDFKIAIAHLAWVILPPVYGRAVTMEKIIGWSRLARRDGLLVLEQRMEEEADPFVKKGMRLLVDGLPPDDIRAVMEVEIENALSRLTCAGRLYEAMGGYSPTIGIIGAVLGLIHVMNNLADTAQLGAGIAVAFVATIYGVGFANLFFIPVSNKLTSLSRDQMEFQEMVLEGFVMIADGDNPVAIQSKLEGYLQ